MFTGIIEEVGSIKNIGGDKIEISAEKVLEDVNLGDSISVNGICLTVVEFDEKSFKADIMPETVRRTSLIDAKKNTKVNLERALTLSARLGGHIVSGHIDGVGEITSLQEDKNALLMQIKTDKSILKYIVEKGSVALDGISLTVASVTGVDFTVSLIPHTREITNLKYKRVGSVINIENDVIAKYVEKLCKNENNENKVSISREFLIENGFM